MTGRLAWICSALVLAGCTTVEPEPLVTDAGAGGTVWPQPPAQARIRHLLSFRGPADLGFRPPLSSRMQGFFGGGTEHLMSRPYAVAVDSATIAVADPGLAGVHLFNRPKRSYTFLDRAGTTPLQSPVGIALSEERIFIADSVTNQVQAVDHEGESVWVLDRFSKPTSLDFDRTGRRLYVADTHGHAVVVVDEQGGSLFSFGVRGSRHGEFNFPSHLKVAGDRLYVTDTLNFRVQVFTLEGRHVRSLGRHGDSPGYLARPKGLAIHPDGHVMVAEAVANRVQIFNLQGEFLLDFGHDGGDPAGLRMPMGMAVHDGRVYVADSGNRRVQVFGIEGAQ